MSLNKFDTYHYAKPTVEFQKNVYFRYLIGNLWKQYRKDGSKSKVHFEGVIEKHLISMIEKGILIKYEPKEVKIKPKKIRLDI